MQTVNIENMPIMIDISKFPLELDLRGLARVVLGNGPDDNEVNRTQAIKENFLTIESFPKPTRTVKKIDKNGKEKVTKCYWSLLQIIKWTFEHQETVAVNTDKSAFSKNSQQIADEISKDLF